MTTITITAADVGMTVAQNGVMSALRFLVADRAMYQHFIIVDDAVPYDAVPHQLFNSDMLTQGTNRNGFFGSPIGVCFEEASISFGNLTVAACPKDAVFEVDCTGALATPVRVTPPPADVYAAHLAQQRAELTALHAERVRTGYNARPPTSLELTPHAAKAEPPKLPDPAMVAADEEGLRLFEAAQAARAQARGPTVVGQSLAEIQGNLRIAAWEAQAEKAKAEAENAATLAMANRITEQRAAAQAGATRLLKEQELL
jgi:hypothetical protein